MKEILGFIGAGSMGGALIDGFIKSGISSKSIIAGVKTEEKKEYLKKSLSIEAYNSNIEVAQKSDILIIAVKPYLVKEVAEEIINHIKKDAIIVSVAASVSKEDLYEMFEYDRVVRVMPNTPVKLCLGYTAVVKSSDKKTEDKITELFKRVGIVHVIEEDKIHAYNAMAGCSPAFIYVLIEAMSDAGVLIGIDRKKSIELASQIFKGASSMVLETNDHPAQLKDSVCTPGGITIKGIRELEENRTRSALIESVYACYKASLDSEKK